MLFDTHAHLVDEKFDDDREETIIKAFESGISLIMVPGADLESSARAVELSERYEGIYASVGVHPHDAQSMDEFAMDKLRELAKSNKVKAIGEIGLDYYYDFSPRETQKYWFKRQLLLAKELKLPVIIHDRDAHKDTMDILKETDAFSTGVLMHCFSGSKESMREYVKLGAYISLAGPLTFKNSHKAVEVASEIPLDRLVIETDSPYLAPVPKRGKRNEPSFVAYVAEKIAEIRHMKTEEIAKITTENGRKYFSI